MINCCIQYDESGKNHSVIDTFIISSILGFFSTIIIVTLNTFVWLKYIKLYLDIVSFFRETIFSFDGVYDVPKFVFNIS